MERAPIETAVAPETLGIVECQRFFQGKSTHGASLNALATAIAAGKHQARRNRR